MVSLKLAWAMRRGEGGRGKRERRVLYQQAVLDVLEVTKIQTTREEILSVLGTMYGLNKISDLEMILSFGT